MLKVMKLIKHCHEVNLANLGVAQGALLGLVADTRLEITHCFPFPSVSDESVNDEDFQIAIESADKCHELCNANIRETWLEQISGSFSDEKYKSWSDEKLHTMLVRAEILFFKTALLACSSGADLMAIAKICVYSR